MGRVLEVQTVEQTDASLIELALSGDTAAYGDLVLRYQDRLYNALVYVTGNSEDARDAVQESLVRAFLKLDSFRGESAFFTWLYRIGFRVAATMQRRKKPMAPLNAPSGGMINEPVDAQHGPLERVQQAEQCRMVQAAIGRLRRDHREVVVLREIEGYDYEEIAEILDIPVGTVRSRLHRGRARLKEELEELLDGD